ncbi:nucleoside triphosphate pyrophosphatase [Sandaracinobacter sp.]|uniref:Maf family protein n=1 Tax=Sandaracinobacter sp. TaxID=2487581 RepID=UPI0035B3C799
MIILASESASRRAMLTAAGVAFEAVPARIDEAAVTEGLRGRPVRDVADRLAELKAVKVSLLRPGMVVLGSDSMLELERGVWLEKPGTADGLRAQLRQLRGRPHRLVSAAVIARDGRPLWRHVEAATLTVRDFSEGWLDQYVAACGAEVVSSVGGYHVEGLGAQLFTRIEGDQFVVRGLPLLAVLGWLREAGELGI